MLNFTFSYTLSSIKGIFNSFTISFTLLIKSSFFPILTPHYNFFCYLILVLKSRYKKSFFPIRRFYSKNMNLILIFDFQILILNVYRLSWLILISNRINLELYKENKDKGISNHSCFYYYKIIYIF